MPSEAATDPGAIPLARWADRELDQLARETGSAAIAALSGAELMVERALLNGFVIPGLVSAGGDCRLRARDGWIALNLARPDDRELLPALFGDAALDGSDAAIAARVARSESAALLAQGRALGMAIAAVDEIPQRPALEILTHGPQRTTPASRPLVVDLSALWAGPLAGRLFRLAGAEVIKVDNPRRPDGLRSGDPAMFAKQNEAKTEVNLDIATAAGRDALIKLIAKADIVIEAARPRALAQLGIDAEALVANQPGLVWLTITGHGARSPQSEWVGFGDDAAVAGGLTAALHETSGEFGFGGDAPADPLTGIVAALAGWRALRSGKAQRIGLAMSAIVSTALAEERATDAEQLRATFRGWAAACGTPFPALPRPI